MPSVTEESIATGKPIRSGHVGHVGHDTLLWEAPDQKHRDFGDFTNVSCEHGKILDNDGYTVQWHSLVT